MKETKKAIIFFMIFLILLVLIWRFVPRTAYMGIHEWIMIIILEIPLQLGIHYLTGKKC